jgi:hypothetical protein
MQGKEVPELLKSKKPKIFIQKSKSGDDIGTMWEEAWKHILGSLESMRADKEEWAYINRRVTREWRKKNPGTPHLIFMFGKDDEFQGEWRSLESQGLVKVNLDDINAQNHYVLFSNERDEQLYRADFEFVTYCHPDGGPLCPVLLGLNRIVCGLTYIRVKFRRIVTRALPRIKNKIEIFELVTGQKV